MNYDKKLSLAKRRPHNPYAEAIRLLLFPTKQLLLSVPGKRLHVCPLQLTASDGHYLCKGKLPGLSPTIASELVLKLRSSTPSWGVSEVAQQCSASFQHREGKGLLCFPGDSKHCSWNHDRSASRRICPVLLTNRPLRKAQRCPLGLGRRVRIPAFSDSSKQFQAHIFFPF